MQINEQINAQHGHIYIFFFFFKNLNVRKIKYCLNCTQKWSIRLEHPLKVSGEAFKGARVLFRGVGSPQLPRNLSLDFRDVHSSSCFFSVEFLNKWNVVKYGLSIQCISIRKCQRESLVPDSPYIINFTSPAGGAHYGARPAAIWQLWEVWTGHWRQPPHQESHLAQCQEIHGEGRLPGGGKRMSCLLMTNGMLCFFCTCSWYYSLYFSQFNSNSATDTTGNSNCGTSIYNKKKSSRGCNLESGISL